MSLLLRRGGSTPVVSTVLSVLNRHQPRTMASTKCVTLDNLNPCIKVMEYAVRGPLVIRATEIEKELEQVGSGKGERDFRSRRRKQKWKWAAEKARPRTIAVQWTWDGRVCLCCAFAWNRPIKLSKIPDIVNSHKGPRFSSSCQLRRHKDGKVTCDKEKRAATHKHNAISIEEGGGESNKNASFYFWKNNNMEISCLLCRASRNPSPKWFEPISETVMRWGRSRLPSSGRYETSFLFCVLRVVYD